VGTKFITHLVSRAIGDHQMPEDYKHNASIDATILMLLRF
jgi:hypothetical protein